MAFGLQDIEEQAERRHLSVFGGVTEALPAGMKTVILLGPREPGFWPHVTAQPEFRDGQPDPLDRWSARVIGDLAKHLKAQAFFPFGGPPHQPFVQWALASGRAHVSPVGLLVHDAAGLMVSYRGALGFGHRIELPEAPPSPCETCETRPCLRACPVDAFGPGGYDVATCKADLDRRENDCMARGCAVRRACPASRSYGRVEEQSAFHMRAFR